MTFSFHFHSKIVELEEELRVVGNNLKSLEVSEEKVWIPVSFILSSPFFLRKEKKINFTWKMFIYNFFFRSFNCCSKSELWYEKQNMSRPTNVKKNTKTKSKHWPPVSRRYNIWYETFESIDILYCQIESLFCVVWLLIVVFRLGWSIIILITWLIWFAIKKTQFNMLAIQNRWNSKEKMYWICWPISSRANIQNLPPHEFKMLENNRR